MHVRKMDGTLAKYDPAKVERSLINSGADSDTIQKIMPKVSRMLYDGITTKEIFRFVYRELRKYSKTIASRYNLKNAMLELGPEGLFFEKFVARILQKQGYSVQVDKIIPGKYVEHEIDVCAYRKPEKMMVECKHHTYPGIYCDIQTALYVYARFLDVKQEFNSVMLATNTKFSNQVLQYANIGLKLMGWKYPKGNSIEENIERFRLYPITVLGSISKNEKNALMKNGIILVSDLISRSGEIGIMLKIPKGKLQELIKEATHLYE